MTVFDDVRLHAWTGGAPCTFDELSEKYLRQSAGQSADGRQGWLNWLLRHRPDGQAMGTVQATLHKPAVDRVEAELAWVIAVEHQGRGFGRESALGMATWLREHGVDCLTAHIHPQHRSSIGIAQALGLTATDIVSEGEVLWSDDGR